jgi:hypothetical protein
VLFDRRREPKKKTKKTYENTELILCFFWCFSKEEERGSREEGKELILCWLSAEEESGRRRRSRVVFFSESNFFSSVGLVPVFVLSVDFKGRRSASRGTDESKKGVFVFWIVTMRVRTRTLVDRRGRASYDCVINSGTEMAEICRNFLR